MDPSYWLKKQLSKLELSRRSSSLSAARATSDLLTSSRSLLDIVNVPISATLGPNQFRLLRPSVLKTADGERYFSCRLEVFDLNQPPIYQALSYTCGPPHSQPEFTHGQLVSLTEDPAGDSQDAVIQCDGSIVKISPFLDHALMTLMQGKIEGWLWVDAICIRQDDLTERALQVQNMRKIFSLAVEVIVWLGDDFGHKGMAKAVKCVKEISERLPEALTDAFEEGRLEPSKMHENSILDPEFEAAIGIDGLLQKLIDYFLFCGFTRWFNRLWVIQEAVLARKLRVLYGLVELDLQMMGLAVIMMNKYGWLNTVTNQLREAFGPRADRDWVAGLHRIYGLCTIMSQMAMAKADVDSDYVHPGSVLHDPDRSMGERFQMCAFVLATVCDAACMDPRDRLYGVLGILDLCFEQDISNFIRVDYFRAQEDIFTDLTSTILTNSQALEVICCKPRDELVTAPLPSWVIDLSKGRCSPSVLFGTGGQLRVDYDAASDLTPLSQQLVLQPPLTITGNRLNCFGTKFDTVSHVAPWVLSVHRHQARLMLETAVRLPTTVSGRPRLRVLWRTCGLNKEIEGSSVAVTSVSMTFINYLFNDTLNAIEKDKLDREQAESRIREVIDLLMEVQTEVELNPDWTVERMVQYLLQRYDALNATETQEQRERLLFQLATESAAAESALTVVERDSKLFITERGLLGVGPSCAEEGDQIWVLRGARRPFVLRPVANREGEFWFAGGCFILDHMHGEMMDERYGTRERARDICIV